MRYGRPGQPFWNGAFGRDSDSLLTARRRLVPDLHLKEKGKTMKLKHPLAAIAATLVLAGCEHTGHVRRLTPEQQEAVRVEQQAAMRAYQAEHRALFLASMQAKLADMDQKLAVLDDTIAALENNSFAEDNLAAVHELRSSVESLFAQLTRLSMESTSAESWYDAQRNLESAWTKLQQAHQLIKAIYDN